MHGMFARGTCERRMWHDDNWMGRFALQAEQLDAPTNLEIASCGLQTFLGEDGTEHGCGVDGGVGLLFALRSAIHTLVKLRPSEPLAYLAAQLNKQAGVIATRNGVAI
jgi:hypothetical protein